MVGRVMRADVDAAELPAVPDAMAEDFAALAAEADQAEGRAPGADVAPQAAPPPTDHAGEAGEVVELVASLALPFVAHRWGQDVADLYGPKQRERIAEALARVAEKRGWSISGVLEGWGPELALAAALAGPILPRMIAAAAPPPPPTKADRPATLPEPAEGLRQAHAGDDGRVL